MLDCQSEELKRLPSLKRLCYEWQKLVTDSAIPPGISISKDPDSYYIYTVKISIGDDDVYANQLDDSDPSLFVFDWKYPEEDTLEKPTLRLCSHADMHHINHTTNPFTNNTWNSRLHMLDHLKIFRDYLKKETSSTAIQNFNNWIKNFEDIGGTFDPNTSDDSLVEFLNLDGGGKKIINKSSKTLAVKYFVNGTQIYNYSKTGIESRFIEPQQSLVLADRCRRYNGISLGQYVYSFTTIEKEWLKKKKSIREDYLYCWDDSMERIGQPNNVNKYEGLPQENGVRAPRWGITLRQIEELLVQTGFMPHLDCDIKDTKADISVRDFVIQYIKPKTENTDMGYALMINKKKPLQVRAMVSHTWEEGILEFYYALQTVVSDPKIPLFICFLSIYQNNNPQAGITIGDQLGSDAAKGPFSEVLMTFLSSKELRISKSDMKELTANGFINGEGGKHHQPAPKLSCGYMLIVPTRYCNIYSRMWCCLELYTAATMGIPTFVSKLPSAIMDLSVSTKDARCGDPKKKEMNNDEKSIRTLIETGVGYEEIDSFIADYTMIMGNVKKCKKYDEPNLILRDF